MKKIIPIIIVIVSVILLSILTITILTSKKENGFIAEIQQAIKAQTETQIKEKLLLAIQELQEEKGEKATLDDITQEWIEEQITDYECTVTTDPSISGKRVIIEDGDVILKFILDENLNITEIEKDSTGIELSYEAIERTGENVQTIITIEDNENGIKRIEFLDEDRTLETYKKQKIAIDNNIELRKEYKVKITTQDDRDVEKTMLMEDYYHTITKNITYGIDIDNKAIKAAYNKPYKAKITTSKEDCIIDTITVTMSGETIEIDKETGEINIDRVTGDIQITATNNYIIKDGILANSNYQIAGNFGNTYIEQRDGYVEYRASAGEDYGAGISWKIQTSINYTKAKCTFTQPYSSVDSFGEPNGYMFAGTRRAGTYNINIPNWNSIRADTSYGNCTFVNKGAGIFTEPKNIEFEILNNPTLFHIGIQMKHSSRMTWYRTFQIYELILE